MKDKSYEYFVIFGGGGIRGISYVGAYKALMEANVKISGYAGSSIGSVFAALCAVGYEISDIEEFFLSINIEFFKDINFNFGNQIALSKGELLLEWMRDKIESKFYGEGYRKGQMPHVRFKDLKEELIIYSTDLTNNKYNEFSKECTPEAEVALALRASVSMPGLFKPLDINGNLIVDGDLAKSWPLWRLSKTLSAKKERILEFRLEDTKGKRNIDTALDYLNAVYNTISGFATDYIIDLYGQKDKFDYIKIDTDNISVMDFMLSESKKIELVETGYKITSDYFKNVLPAKRKKLYENYYQIQLFLLKFKREFEANKIKNAYLILCELFSHLCEHKRYIDLYIYNSLLEFKKQFDDNLQHKTGFFFIKDMVLLNKNLVEKNMNELIKVITLKTVEIKD